MHGPRQAAQVIGVEHQQRPDSDQSHSERTDEAHPLPQEYEGQQHRQHRAQLVDRHDLADAAELERFEVAQPGSPGCQPREHQQTGAAGIEVGQFGLRADDEHHAPGARQHHNSAQRCRHGRVRGADPLLGQDGGDAGKKR